MSDTGGQLKRFARSLTEGLSIEATVILVASTVILAFLLHHPTGYPLHRWFGYNFLMLFVLPILILSIVHPQRKRESNLWWIVWALVLAATAACTVLLLRMRTLSPSPRGLAALSALILVALVYLARRARLRLSDYGVALGDWKRWGTACMVLFALMVPVLLFASRLEAFQKTYPLFRQAAKGWKSFLTVQAYFGGYWFAWEFFFRGFLLFGLARRYGAPTAILVQAIPFTFMHFGKPELEVYASFIAGIALGYLDWRGKSMLPSFLLHWMVALSMDLLAVLT